MGQAGVAGSTEFVNSWGKTEARVRQTRGCFAALGSDSILCTCSRPSDKTILCRAPRSGRTS
jgi:hypothetical protein